jgi:hypothetical protein
MILLGIVIFSIRMQLKVCTRLSFGQYSMAKINMATKEEKPQDSIRL